MEGFWTGTRAAAFGGVTTVIDMPLDAVPPTTTVAGLKEKIAAAKGKCWVDVAFYGGIIPGNQKLLKPLMDMGVRGFEGFLIDSGYVLTVAISGHSPSQDTRYQISLMRILQFSAVSSTDIALAMAELADEPTTLMFHAEMIPKHRLCRRRCFSTLPYRSSDRLPNVPRLPPFLLRSLRHRTNRQSRPPRSKPTFTHRAPLRHRKPYLYFEKRDSEA